MNRLATRALLDTAVRRRTELVPLALALGLLPWTVARLRLSRGRVVGDTAAPGSRAARVDARCLARARRLQRVVELASMHGFARGTCLSRSLTLLHLLRREGIPGQLRIGVRGPAGGFEAHAWVECGGAVLNDAPDVDARYLPFGGPAGGTPREAR